MSTYTQLIYHIVFSTKNRTTCLTPAHRPDLYKYIWGILKNKNCHLYRIGGIEDHIHIVTHIPTTISIPELIKDLKLASSDYIKTNHLFPTFIGWQGGYSAFTVSYKGKDRLIEYVKNQEDHHRIHSFNEELIQLLIEHGINFDEKFLI